MGIHDSGYVYVISDEQNRVKLGLSIDADMRLDILQIGNADLLTVKYRLLVKNMKKAEDALHSIFSGDHIRGEWYKIKNIELFNKIFRIADTNERDERLLESLGLR